MGVELEFRAQLDEFQITGGRIHNFSIWGPGDWELSVFSGMRIDYLDLHSFLLDGGWNRSYEGQFNRNCSQLKNPTTLPEILACTNVSLRWHGDLIETKTKKQRKKLRCLFVNGETSFDNCTVQRWDGNCFAATAINHDRFYLFIFQSS